MPVTTAFYQELPYEKAIQETGLGFTDNNIEIGISPARGYPPIRLCAIEYVPVDDDDLICDYLEINSREEHSAKFETCRPPPLALTKTAICTLRNQWEECINGAVDGERYIGELEWGDTSQVAWDLYHAVKNYSKSTGVSMILELCHHSLIILHRTHLRENVCNFTT